MYQARCRPSSLLQFGTKVFCSDKWNDASLPAAFCFAVTPLKLELPFSHVAGDSCVFSVLQGEGPCQRLSCRTWRGMLYSLVGWGGQT